MDKKVAVISALFEKKNKRKPKNSKELQDFIKQQGGEEFLKKVDEYISQAEAEQSKQAQKAEHGAKLQYFKKLKNQCADDEEVVYYKKGGLVDCGCKKKEGGEVVKANFGTFLEKIKNKFNSTVQSIGNAGQQMIKQEAQKQPFKNKPKQTKKGTTWGETSEVIGSKGHDRGNGGLDARVQDGADTDKGFNRGYMRNTKGGEIKKNCDGSKVISKFKAKCGSKIKKHQQGGSLNGIPFYQEGTPKGGIPTAPKATDRYKGGFILNPNHWYFQTSMKYKDGTSTGVAENVNYWQRTPSIITQQILDKDTIYRETPGQKRFALRGFPVTRQASYSGNNKQEYLTLKRRFNEAKSVAKKP